MFSACFHLCAIILGLRASPRVPNIFTCSNTILEPPKKFLGIENTPTPTMVLYFIPKTLKHATS